MDFRPQPYGPQPEIHGISHALKNLPPACGDRSFRFPYGAKKEDTLKGVFFFGDPYGNRTHVTAVKGRCLNRLTNGPGSGDLT